MARILTGKTMAAVARQFVIALMLSSAIACFGFPFEYAFAILAQMLTPIRSVPFAVNHHANVLAAILRAAALASPVLVRAPVVVFMHSWFSRPSSLLNSRESIHLSNRLVGMKYTVPSPSSWADKPSHRSPIIFLVVFMSFFQFG